MNGVHCKCFCNVATKLDRLLNLCLLVVAEQRKATRTKISASDAARLVTLTSDDSDVSEDSDEEFVLAKRTRVDTPEAAKGSKTQRNTCDDLVMISSDGESRSSRNGDVATVSTNSPGLPPSLDDECDKGLKLRLPMSDDEDVSDFGPVASESVASTSTCCAFDW